MKNNLAANALSSLKGKLPELFAPTFFFLMASIVTCALGLLSSASLFITIPLILVPIYFCYQMYMFFLLTGQRNESESGAKTFFRFFIHYFRSDFSGCYRIMRTILIGLGIMVASSFAYFIIYYLIGTIVSPQFRSLAADFLKYYMTNDLESLTAMYTEQPIIRTYVSGVTVVQSIAMFFFCFYQLGYYSLSPYMMAFYQGESTRLTMNVYVRTMRNFRDIKRTYYSAAWPGIVVVSIGLLGGAALGYFLCPPQFDPFALASITALAGALLLLTFYLPYHCAVGIELMKGKMMNCFIDTSINMMKEYAERIKLYQELDEKELKDLEERLNRITNSIENEKRKNEEDSSNEDNSDSN
ncbi:MAG: DUF2062 domain-containing protein [Bacilli bacterium]|nr:DUF2062 domain-containing protein [Bacilli bacterium]